MTNIHEFRFDFCVVGGGLAGMCAAIAAARHGTKVALIQERPVLGGNASSEMRMWVCGASGKGNRETGIIEEIALENLYRNPDKLWPIWDSILYEKVRYEPNIELFLNCSVFDAETEGGKIISVTGWQMTTQRVIRIYADNFADCSGDSVLAPLTGAAYRHGRESADEFGEVISVTEADRRTMGMSCLIQARKLDHPVTFIAPDWALDIDEEQFRRRKPNLESSYENYWYMELGGDCDSVSDSEDKRDELLSLAFGMWNYIKNSGEFDADLWQLDFVGFLPAKRESRRMVGKYMMTQTDIVNGVLFPDTVAYGGWPLDDHDPRGFWHVGPPNTSVQTTSPYAIPYRCLYSANVENLFFAGRNISMTHAAMSSARVMATCALLGQAVGTAASVAHKYSCSPDEVYTSHIDELQQTLLFDDCMLPGIPRRVSKAISYASVNADAYMLRDGLDRNNPYTAENGTGVSFSFGKPEFVNSVRIVFDSDLDRTTLPGDACERQHSMRCNVNTNSPTMTMPKTLCKSFIIEGTDEDGEIIDLWAEDCNTNRLVIVPVVRTLRAITVTALSNWGGSETTDIFSVDIG